MVIEELRQLFRRRQHGGGLNEGLGGGNGKSAEITIRLLVSFSRERLTHIRPIAKRAAGYPVSALCILNLLHWKLLYSLIAAPN